MVDNGKKRVCAGQIIEGILVVEYEERVVQSVMDEYNVCEGDALALLSDLN